MTKNRFLAAIDGSVHSWMVLEKAIEYARIFTAEIVLVYCHKKYPKLLGQPYRDQVISSIMDQTQETVAPFVRKLEESGLPFTQLMVEEPAGSMIPIVAGNEKCELIIMGSRGLTDLEGLIVGSVTHRVLHLAKCPVLVVK